MKNNVFKVLGMAFLGLSLFNGTTLCAQTDQRINVNDSIRKYDALFWKAYNSCDVEKLRGFFTEDLEFYHDKSGLTKGLKPFMESIKNGICSKADWRLRREALDSTINVYPINNYGGIITGEHLFYVTENGQQERPEGKARFFHVWQYQNGLWKMSRVISYDHGPMPMKQNAKAISLSETKLQEYAGNYNSPQAGLATVLVEDDHLFLKSGGFQAPVYAMKKDVFFMKEGNIQFRFSRDDDGKIAHMLIFQGDTQVDRADRVK